MDAPFQRWLARRPQPRAGLRLFCFPYAGGGISSYLPWQEALGGDVEVCAVQLPGRGSRLLEPSIDSFPRLIELLTQLVAGHADRPYALFGHSLGALMAFEVARALRSTGERAPKLLIVSGCEAPHDRPDVRRLHELDDAALADALAKLNGTPAMVLENEELMRLVLPAIRADFALNAGYAYRDEAPLEVPVMILAGEEDTHAQQPRVERWREQTSLSAAMHVLPGDHFFIDSQGPALMKLLRTALQDLAASPPTAR